MRRWTEPYPSPIDRSMYYWSAGLLTLLGLAMLCGLVGEGGEPHVGWLVLPAGLAVAGTLAWRMLHIGVAVGDRGVRVRTVPRTRILPWSAVERAWVGPATRRPPARAVWITVRASAGRRDVETLLWLAGTNDRYGFREAVVLESGDLTGVVELINRRARHRGGR